MTAIDHAILNPMEPLAYLPAKVASQIQLSRHVYSATIGARRNNVPGIWTKSDTRRQAYLWDSLVNLESDYLLLFKLKIRGPTAVYYLSRSIHHIAPNVRGLDDSANRTFTFSYILTNFVHLAVPVKDCSAIIHSIGALYVLSTCSTAMLFLIRVTAVWHESKLAKTIFYGLWASILGCSIAVPIGITSRHIGPTQQCIDTAFSPSTVAGTIMMLVNDSAIFLAISFRVLNYAVVDDGLAIRARAFFGGGRISRLARALLQGGQQYYLVAVLFNVLTLILFYAPGLPPVWHGMMGVPSLAITNAMACIVFRKIKLDALDRDGVTLPLIPLAFVDIEATQASCSSVKPTDPRIVNTEMLTTKQTM
ncbi:hypothetical protein HGRIS_000263 [Hohenbuehelia grisea]|uniref:Uncharacterized protein n=1 Tax=Hohenbuehelia grisea TaxID=104357 RepID=A0ABR3JSD3_9AGAR